MKIIHLLHIAYFCASSAKKVEVEEAIQPKPLQEPKKVEVEEAIQPKPLQEPKKVEAEEEIQLKPLHEEQKKIQRKEKRMNFRPNHGSNLARIKSKSIRRKSRAAAEFRYEFLYDCHHSSHGNTHTANTVYFRFKDVNGYTIKSRSKTISSSECGDRSGYHSEWVQTTSQLDFAYVELMISGEDAFLIDQAKIHTYELGLGLGISAEQWHGRGSKGFELQNAGYYCLSLDRGDYGGNCGYKLKFYFKDVGSHEAGSVWRWR